LKIGKNNNCEFLRQALHDIEEAKRKLNHEVGTLLAPDGSVIKEYGGNAHNINIPNDDVRLFEGNIFTHNHPGGGNFTVQDIKSFADNGLKEVRVSTPQGTYYSLQTGEGEINRSIANVMKEEKVESSSNAMNILQKQIDEQNLVLTGHEYQKRLFGIIDEEVDRWLSENAAEFGYEYKKGMI